MRLAKEERKKFFGVGTRLLEKVREQVQPSGGKESPLDILTSETDEAALLRGALLGRAGRATWDELVAGRLLLVLVLLAALLEDPAAAAWFTFTVQRRC